MLYKIKRYTELRDMLNLRIQLTYQIVKNLNCGSPENNVINHAGVTQGDTTINAMESFLQHLQDFIMYTFHLYINVVLCKFKSPVLRIYRIHNKFSLPLLVFVDYQVVEMTFILELSEIFMDRRTNALYCIMSQSSYRSFLYSCCYSKRLQWSYIRV
jgi:hypothetical protein